MRRGKNVENRVPCFDEREENAAASEEAVSYGANTFMIIPAPRKTRDGKIEELNIEEGRKHMAPTGSRIIVHAPYIINIGNTKTMPLLN